MESYWIVDAVLVDIDMLKSQLKITIRHKAFVYVFLYFTFSYPILEYSC